jgi:hypothetical protein
MSRLRPLRIFFAFFAVKALPLHAATYLPAIIDPASEIP